MMDGIVCPMRLKRRAGPGCYMAGQTWQSSDARCHYRNVVAVDAVMGKYTMRERINS